MMKRREKGNASNIDQMMAMERMKMNDKEILKKKIMKWSLTTMVVILLKLVYKKKVKQKEIQKQVNFLIQHFPPILEMNHI